MADESFYNIDDFAVLDDIVRRQQTWSGMAAKYGVENPLPPWKTSLDGLCDVLDRTCYSNGGSPLTFKERRAEEDELSATRYGNLPFPESQLISLAYSLLARGIISEDELRQRLSTVRARLED